MWRIFYHKVNFILITCQSCYVILAYLALYGEMTPCNHDLSVVFAVAINVIIGAPLTTISATRESYYVKARGIPPRAGHMVGGVLAK